MTGLPKEGKFTRGTRDPITGMTWVHVTPEMAKGHPQGQLSLTLYAVLLVFAAFGALRLVIWLQSGQLWYFVEAVVMILAIVTLFLRIPPGRVLGIVACVLVLVDFATGAMLLFQLLEAIAAVTVGFYLLVGARPNLIYRHRYLASEAPEEGGDV